MALQFVIGSSGSGKTTWMQNHIIEESIKNPRKQYYIIVPEQFTMETQKAVVLAHPRKGTMNIEVTSFVRLAYKVFKEVGFEDYIVLDDMGKCVILQKTAQKLSGELRVFAKNLKKQGFISELKSMLSELYQYGISADMLESAGKKLGNQSILAGKIADMTALYRAFTGELEDNTFTAEEILPLLAKYLPECGFLDGAVVVFDEYTGFTPIQYQVLRPILHAADQVLIGVTVDPCLPYQEDGPAYDLFYLSRHTISSLMNLAKEEDIDIMPEICLTSPEDAKALEYAAKKHHYQIMPVVNGHNRFKGSKELSFLEKNVMRYQRGLYQTEGEKADIYMTICPSPAEEVRHIGEEIYRLIMEGAYRYREIALITGKPEVYNPLIEQELNSYGFPFFLDEKHTLLRNPLVEYLRSLLELIDLDYSYESVFRFLKCGICEIPREDRDYIENYVIALGIRGHKRWSEDWLKEKKSRSFVDFERLNRIRKAVFASIESFREEWKKKDNTVRTRVCLLKKHMEEHALHEKMEELTNMFYEQGDRVTAKEYDQAYDAVIALLDEIEALLGDQIMSRKDFAACFDSGLGEIKVGVIPSNVDRLLVGDMERTRLSGIKVLFFAGVNEGQVPVPAAGGGIFTDYDKEQLKECEIELAPTGRMNSFMSRFYLYLALTKPSDCLRISCAKNDGNGKSLHPASVITEISSMFPSLKVLDLEDKDEGKDTLPSGLNGNWRYLVKGFRELSNSMENPVWMTVYAWFYQNYPEKTLELTRAFSDGYRPETLTAELARSLYGQALMAGVSRLEKQAACAFSHYLQYGLKLEERESFSFESTDMGTLFHKAIENYFNAVSKKNLSITNIDPAQRKDFVKTAVADAARMLRSDILNDNARNKWLAGRLERITDRTAWALGEQMKEGGYITEGCEVKFNSDNTRAFEIPLEDGTRMLLEGKIDRVDLKDKDDKMYVRIIDYKSGSTSFDLVSVYYGTQIQLVFYMEAAQERLKKTKSREIIPGGVLYYNIADPIVEKKRGMTEAAIADAILSELNMNGLVNFESLEEEEKEKLQKSRSKAVQAVSSAQFELLRVHVKDIVSQLGNDIMAGKIDVNPYKRGQKDACRFCGYKSICGFDQKRKGFRYRNLVNMDKDEIWEELEKEEVEDGNDMDE